ncbi:aldehyde dehydrogenase [Xylariomycetidae sp. FL2044]|nr:aldehyde dehydrogenase [Xylariomycetidae sp. FL2044]
MQVHSSLGNTNQHRQQGITRRMTLPSSVFCQLIGLILVSLLHSLATVATDHTKCRALRSNSKMSLNLTTFQNVINGKLVSTEKTRRTINPCTLEQNPGAPLSSRDDVNLAVASARAAAKSWAGAAWQDRAEALLRFADIIDTHTEELAQLLGKEQGKPINWGRAEISASAGYLREFCKLSLAEECIEDTEERKVVARFVPLGVVVGIVPWNYPIQMAVMKFGPALLTGNPFIWKPSPYTPYCTLKIAELGLQVFPPGVLQAVSGEDILGLWLTEHADVDMVTFTGSVPTGKKVMETCSRTLKRVTLELGGNDAAILCADIDAVAVATKLAFIAFCNAGAICIGPKRIYVHESVYDAVLAATVAFAESVQLGLDEASHSGPVANERQFDQVKELFADLEKTQAKIATGSTKALDRKGYFFAPSVVDNPPEESRVVQEEQFAPILPLMRWSDEDDVIRRANDTKFGLGASVWSRDLAQAKRLADQLQAGNVWINTHAELGPNIPFAGHKQSGLGVEMGVEGFKCYCNVQSVYTRPA